MKAAQFQGQRIVIAGGSGYLGQRLIHYFVNAGAYVVVLTRQKSPASAHERIRYEVWDGQNLGPWSRVLAEAQAVVNLAGRSVDCRPTAENRRAILESRVHSVRVLGDAMRALPQRPPVWIQASALALYGNGGEAWLDESAGTGTDFMADTARQWEATLGASEPAGTRTVTLRIGIVLGPQGGAGPTLVRLARWGLGGSAGDGLQYVSWLHEIDFVRMVATAILSAQWKGAYNACTPTPVTNAEFMRTLRQAVRRPWSPPAPAWAVRLGAQVLNTNPELVLTGRRCRPRRLTEAGFEFAYTDIASAWRAVVDRT